MIPDLDPPPRWHTLTAIAAQSRLDAPNIGLNPIEIAARRERFGANSLPPTPRTPGWKRLLAQFHNVLIYLLLVAGGVTLALGHGLDAGVIFGVVVINALIGFIQEGRAEQALDAIRAMLPPHAVVTRGGQKHEIDATELVPGDIVHLASGDKVPADLRLITVNSLRVSEAALTGESLPVEKQAEALAVDAALADRDNMAWSGTLVSYGQATGVVVATGTATELGRVNRLLAGVTPLTTPLVQQMTRFGRGLALAILLLSVGVFVFGVWGRGYPMDAMFIAVVGLAVAAIPEGLPAILTITLAIGVTRMAHRHAIIRRLPAVETLGAVSVICTDKTGTLTRNEMTVQRVITADRVLAVSGSGYAPDGGFSDVDDSLKPSADPAPAAPHRPEPPCLIEIARAALLCNDAELHDTDSGWQLTGDPTEGALLALANKVGVDAASTRADWPRRDAIPFESQHRFMATLHHDHAGHGHVYLKGAPERVLALCSAHADADGGSPAFDAAAWQAPMDAAAAQGMRLLALAVRDEVSTQLDFASIERGGFTLLAVLGLADPPRDEARQAIATCHAAGIVVKMITGDHAVTAQAIGQQLGLDATRVLTGADLDALDAAQLQATVREVHLYARASPEHKLRLVEALQRQGYVTAMTGDGVNDAPALKRADVGVAMGNKGTAAARDASEMVLADDNFASIVHAVEEGRTAYGNLRKALIFALPTNLGEAGMILIAIAAGLTLPITPVQILWVNMVTAITLALALAFERPEPGTMQRPPRDPHAPLLTRFMLWRIGWVSVVLVLGALGLFQWALARGDTLDVARTVAVNALVVGEIFYLYNCRRLTAPVWGWQGLTGNPAVLIAISVLVVLQALFTFAPPLQALFNTAAPDALAWAAIVAFGASVYGGVEIEKAVVRRYFAEQG